MLGATDTRTHPAIHIDLHNPAATGSTPSRSRAARTLASAVGAASYIPDTAWPEKEDTRQAPPGLTYYTSV